MHSGINTGLVVTAEVDPEKGSQGVAGDAVNLAARLSGLAGRRGDPGGGRDGPEDQGEVSSFRTWGPNGSRGRPNRSRCSS